MAKPYPTIETQVLNRPGSARKAPPPLVPSLSLSVPFTDIPNDATNEAAFTFSVQRAGGNLGTSDATWTVVPAAGSPIPAAYFGGSYPTGPVHLDPGQGQQSCVIRVPAGADPSADTFANIVLSGFTGCKAGPTTAWPIKAPGSVLATDAVVGVSVPIVVLTRDDALDTAYSIAVTRSGNAAVACSVRLALAGAGTTPLTAADFVGGLLDQTVNFAIGETDKSYAVTVKAGTDPATDLTGAVTLSAPVGCKTTPLNPTVAVKIPKAATVVSPGLPDCFYQQYTDPDFTGMTAYSTAVVDNFAKLDTAAKSIQNSAKCKTTYIELASGFNETVIRTLAYKGYVENAGKASEKIYPLIICGPLSKIKDRSKISQLPHFYELSLNGSTWVWLYGLAAEWTVRTAAGNSQGTQRGSMDDAAIDLDGSTDCFVTRCWLDAPQGIHSQTAVRPRVGANDFYGTPFRDEGWQSQFYAQFSGGTGGAQGNQKRTIGATIYQNYFGNLRPQATIITTDPVTHKTKTDTADNAAGFYAGDGVAPDIDAEGNYPDEPYDLNWRESWFFNNYICTTRNYLIYNKHACNIWRNRVTSVDVWNAAEGTGSAFHLIACRGGNWTGGTVKYNVIRAKGQHSDLQSWKGVAEFNDWGGQDINLFIHCGRDGRQPDPPHKLWKTLLAASYWRFRGNKNGNYNIGVMRADGSYIFHAPLLDGQWEGETDRITWQWETTTSAVTCNPSGGTVKWNAITNKNSENFTIKDGSDPVKTAVAAGQLVKLPTNSVTALLTLADAGNGFTKGEKGITSTEGITWDFTGKAGPPVEPPPVGDYSLTQALMTVWWPYDDMVTNLPASTVVWLPGGGFELTAGNNGTIHSCMNIWHKNAPPAGDCTFTFYATLLDANGSAEATGEGIFALFRVRQKGLSAYGADPNGWAPASYRTHPLYTAPGSDNLVRDRTTGHRFSFANHAQAPDTKGNSMQFRLRKMDGGDDSRDDSTPYTPTTPNPVPTTGDSFLFVKDRKYKLVVTRSGTTLTAVKTDTTDASLVQTWAYDDAELGPASGGGIAVGGWCGFAAYLNRAIRIEPVAGTPFCA